MGLTSRIQALTAYANEVTGESDTTLADAVATLAEGYGQGGGEWSTEGLANGSEPNGELVITGARIADNTFCYKNGITKVIAPNATYLGAQSFMYCTNITECSFPKVTSIGYNTFRGAKFTQLTFPSLSGRNQLSCEECSNLTTLDFGKNSQEIQEFGAYNASNLDTIILRRTASACVFSNLNNLGRTPFHPKNNTAITKTGTLYVPSALVESYKTATNWSTLYNAGTMDVLPIEGSIYETQYADGTAILQ